MNPLNAYLAQSVIADRYALADAHRRARRERPQRGPVTYDSVTIRRVTPDDWRAVERLAQLESRPPLRGEALLAEVGDRVLAAHSLHDGATLADPFEPTAELVTLLKARARQASGTAASFAKPVRRAVARVLAGVRYS
jgi:hypothetical protein